MRSTRKQRRAMSITALASTGSDARIGTAGAHQHHVDVARVVQLAARRACPCRSTASAPPPRVGSRRRARRRPCRPAPRRLSRAASRPDEVERRDAQELVSLPPHQPVDRRDRSTGARSSSRSSTPIADGSASSRRVQRAARRCGLLRPVARAPVSPSPASTAILPGWRPRYAGDMPRVRVALCQLNTVVGDLDGNAARILDAYERGRGRRAATSPCSPSWPSPATRPRTSCSSRASCADNREALDKVAAAHRALRRRRRLRRRGPRPVQRGRGRARTARSPACYHKRLLPNYAVFDEQRYFVPGAEPLQLFVIAGVEVGVSICEDAWSPFGPIAEQAAGGAELVVNLNASPYYAGPARRARAHARDPRRRRVVRARLRQPGRRPGRARLRRRLARVRRRRLVSSPGPRSSSRTCSSSTSTSCRSSASACSTLAGGPRRRTSAESWRSAAHAPTHDDAPTCRRSRAAADRDDEVYEALVLGTRDYVEKNGFTDVVLGLSGGIDSSLVAVHRRRRARRRARARRRHAVALLDRRLDHRRRAAVPTTSASTSARSRSSRRTRPCSRCSPRRSADSSPTSPRRTCRAASGPRSSWRWRTSSGWLVLTSGNKSEMAVGYSTLYGDMAGGFAVIKDVFKTDGLRARARTATRPRATTSSPIDVLEKPPSAELRARPARRPEPAAVRGARPDPRRRTSRATSPRAELVEAGFDAVSCGASRGSSTSPSTSAARRRLGVRVTPKAFGKDRRLPITNAYAADTRAGGTELGSAGDAVPQRRCSACVLFDAVLFDFNGVLTTSPFAHMAALGDGPRRSTARSCSS